MNITVRPTRKIPVSESELLETNIIVSVKDLCNMDSTVILELMTWQISCFSSFLSYLLIFLSITHISKSFIKTRGPSVFHGFLGVFSRPLSFRGINNRTF